MRVSTKDLLAIRYFAFCCLISIAAFCPAARANVTLPSIISDNMVLQQGERAPIWGKASPGEAITVTFQKQKLHTIANSLGDWQVELKDLKPGGAFELHVKGADTITVKNILVGETWLCAGQSNMGMSLLESQNGEKEYQTAKETNIRFFRVEHQRSSDQAKDVIGHWEICSPLSAAKFSAVGYYFGSYLYEHLTRPIGLIEAAWCGTPAELWISKQALESQKDKIKVLGRWNQQVDRYESRIPAWYAHQCAKRHIPMQPTVPAGIVSASLNTFSDYWEPSSLFNGMIKPLAPFSLAGVIWYQGESNVFRTGEYRELLSLLIADWRVHWRSELPFIYVQLPNFAKVKTKTSKYPWAEIREAQLKALSMPRTAMVVSIDLGDPANIHPRSKSEVGRRLALAALAKVYNQPIEYSGPLYKSTFFRKGVAIVSFSHAEGGLKISSGNELTGFALSGPNHVFFPAKAKILEDKVFVVSPAVKTPVAVRYAWANNPQCNLVNAHNLPASPFRTDIWTN